MSLVSTYPAVSIQLCLFFNLVSNIQPRFPAIGAFNIQTFGQSKYSNNTIVSHLVNIVVRYDLILIQEIRDKSETVIKNFLEDCKSVNEHLDMIVSPRLGRTSYKEQYAIIYNTKLFSALKDTVYPDADDIFARPPLVVHFEHQLTKIPFTVYGVHIDPDEVVSELNEFPKAYEWAVNKGYPKSGLLMGDLNADCSYLSDEKYHNLEINSRDEFKWLVDKTVDTTVSTNTDCAYDRILILADFQLSNFTNTSVDFFDKDISNELAKKISNHYPIRTYLKVHLPQDDGISTDTSDDTSDEDTKTAEVPQNGVSLIGSLIFNVVSKLVSHYDRPGFGSAIGFIIFCCYIVARRYLP